MAFYARRDEQALIRHPASGTRFKVKVKEWRTKDTSGSDWPSKLWKLDDWVNPLWNLPKEAAIYITYCDRCRAEKMCFNYRFDAYGTHLCFECLSEMSQLVLRKQERTLGT